MEELEFTPEECCSFVQLPTYDYLFSLLNKAINVLENEIKWYRMENSKGKPGSLIELEKNKNLIVVPDIHARPFFIKNILNFNIPLKYKVSSKQITVLQALQKQKINVVCVGDAFHTEKTNERWLKIQQEFNDNCFEGPNMIQEMKECLSSFCAILTLKILFPENFHFLKGNHENILNVCSNGDFSFCKYADEGNMVKTFISSYYGDDILYLISCYENLLPLVASSKYCVISHAEPSLILNRKQIINAKLNPEFVHSFIWTKNDVVVENTAEEIIKNLLNSEDLDKAIYLGGHRPVSLDFALRQNEKYIQIHNPSKQNIALVSYKRKFNPKKDIYGVEQ